MPSDSSPLPYAPYGPGRTSNPPLRTRLDTPDHGGESQSGQPQRAGVYTLDPVDASAAAPGRGLLPPPGQPAALSTSCATSAALRDSLPHPRSGFEDQDPAHVNVSAHDTDSLALTGTLYVPYVERSGLPDSVPKFTQPISSDRSSSLSSPRPVGPVNADANEDDYPNAAVTEGSLAAPPIITLGTSDALQFGTSSCPARLRLGEVSVLSGPPVNATAIVDAHGNDDHHPAALSSRARDGALITTGTGDALQFGTTSCPVRLRLGEVSVPSDPSVNASVSFNANAPTSASSRSCGEAEGSLPVPLSAGDSKTNPPSSDHFELPPQAVHPPEDDGNHQAMRDEIDQLQRQQALANAKYQNLVYENASLADQLHLAKESLSVATDTSCPGRVGHRLSGAVHPRAGSELGSLGRADDEARTSRRHSAAAPYNLPPSSAAAAVDPGFSHPPSPSVPPPLRLPPSGSPHRPVASKVAPSPSGRPLEPVPPSRCLPPDSPPPHAPHGTPVAPPPTSDLDDCPAWYCAVISSSGCAVTGPIPSWKCAKRCAPRTAAFSKLRQAQSSGMDRLVNLLILMGKNPGMVRCSYPRVVQCLADQFVTFYFLNGADVDSNTLNSETLRFFSDACSAASCPTKITTCFLECCSSYSSRPGAVPSDSPSYPEHLLRYSLSSIILELSPPFAAMLEITFNNSTKLAEGENIFSFLTRVREAASTGNIPQSAVRSRIVSVVQEASANPLVDRAVLNEVSNRLSEMMVRSESLNSFLSSIKTAAGVGGYLNEPIIPRSPTSVVPGDFPRERS